MAELTATAERVKVILGYLDANEIELHVKVVDGMLQVYCASGHFLKVIPGSAQIIFIGVQDGLDDYTKESNETDPAGP